MQGPDFALKVIGLDLFGSSQGYLSLSLGLGVGFFQSQQTLLKTSYTGKLEKEVRTFVQITNTAAMFLKCEFRFSDMTC